MAVNILFVMMDLGSLLAQVVVTYVLINYHSEVANNPPG